jgi:hypothetical protein
MIILVKQNFRIELHRIFKISRNFKFILNYINEFMYNSKNSLNLCLIQQNFAILGKNQGKIGFYRNKPQK